MSGEPLLKVQGVETYYGNIRALAGVDVEVKRGEIVSLIADCIRQKPAADWFHALDAAGIPAGPINSVTEALAEVQAQHRQVLRLMSGGALGEVRTVGSPIRIDGSRCDSDLPPPALGEHTFDILRTLDLGAEALADLRSRGVIG